MSPFTKNSEMTSLILDSLPMGVLFCDMDYIIRFVNKAYADLLGRRPEELLGCDITEIIPHSRARVVLRDGRAEMGELCQLGPGNALPVVVNRIPVRDGQGRLAGMVSQAIFNDPEELKKLSSKIDHLGHTLNQYKRRIKASLAPQYSLRSILGESAPMRRLKQQVRSYAQLDAPVLILGATGAGKELFAHALHTESPRAEGPLVSINCAAIPKDLFESELFGYARGAFSGAHQDGKFIEIPDIRDEKVQQELLKDRLSPFVNPFPGEEDNEQLPENMCCKREFTPEIIKIAREQWARQGYTESEIDELLRQ